LGKFKDKYKWRNQSRHFSMLNNFRMAAERWDKKLRKDCDISGIFEQLQWSPEQLKAIQSRPRTEYNSIYMKLSNE